MPTDENQTEPVVAQETTEELELELDDSSVQQPLKVEGGKKFEDMTSEELIAVAKKQHGIISKAKSKPTVQPPKPKKEEIGELGTRLSNLELLEKKRQFGYEMGLSPDETDKVFRFNQNPTKETLDDEFVKAGLDAIRKKKRVSEATPSPTGRSSKVEGKSFGELKPEERKANFEKLKKNMLGK